MALTARSVPEWIGSHPDAAIPPRVLVRLFDRAGGRCQSCGVKPLAGAWQADHITALVNGGEHRETNLQVLCTPCHKLKSRADVAEKSKVARVRAKHIGAKRTAQPLPGSRNHPSGLRKRMNGEVTRW